MMYSWYDKIPYTSKSCKVTYKTASLSFSIPATILLAPYSHIPRYEYFQPPWWLLLQEHQFRQPVSYFLALSTDDVIHIDSARPLVVVHDYLRRCRVKLARGS